MTIETYIDTSARTAPRFGDVLARLTGSDTLIKLFNCAVGLSTEATEMLHATIGDAPPDVPNRGEEIGDWCWYAALGNRALQLPSPVLLGHVRKSERAYKEAVIEAVLAAGALLDVVKKLAFHGPDPKLERSLPILLANCWLVAAKLAGSSGLKLDEVLDRNDAKLRTRYPDGLTADASANRNLAAERAVLELPGVVVSPSE